MSVGIVVDAVKWILARNPEIGDTVVTSLAAWAEDKGMSSLEVARLLSRVGPSSMGKVDAAIDAKLDRIFKGEPGNVR